MQHWEYRIFQFVTPDKAISLYDDIPDLNGLGDQGWEAVGFSQVAGYQAGPPLTVLLKRPKEATEGVR